MYGHNTQPHALVSKFLRLVEAKPHPRLLPLPAIAMELGVSLSHLQHLVRRHTGMTCTKIIWQKCVRQMETHLRDHPEKTIAEIAYEWGFDPKTMRRHFAVELGITPSSLRKEDRS